MFTEQTPPKTQGISSDRFALNLRLTRVGLVVAVGSGRGRSISSFHFQGVSSLLLSIEDHFGEHLTGLHVDLEELLALVPRRVHNEVVHLFTGHKNRNINTQLLTAGAIERPLWGGSNLSWLSCTPEQELGPFSLRTQSPRIYLTWLFGKVPSLSMAFTWVTFVPIGSPSSTVSCSRSVNKGISSFTSSSMI